MECAQGDRPARCPNHFFAVNEPSAVPWWWCDLFWCNVGWCDVRPCDLMRCDCLCCVMSRDAMRCHVMCAHVLSYHLLCPAMGWNLRCHWFWGHIVCSKWRFKVLFCTTKHYSVLQSTTPLLPCTTQYYSVLHSATPVLLCTTKYYSSTTLYCKVLLQYYSVLHSTTTCYSSTTLYYKAAFMIDVRRIWNVIYNARSNRSHPPTSRNTAPATQNDCDDWSASHMKRHLQWAEQQESQSIFTKYCTCHAKWMPSVIRVTYETSFTMRGATRVTLHLHQILRLPRKMNLMIDPPHIWNVI